MDDNQAKSGPEGPKMSFRAVFTQSGCALGRWDALNTLESLKTQNRDTAV